jgi:hypothetical protein
VAGLIKMVLALLAGERAPAPRRGVGLRHQRHQRARHPGGVPADLGRAARGEPPGAAAGRRRGAVGGLRPDPGRARRPGRPAGRVPGGPRRA